MAAIPEPSWAWGPQPRFYPFPFARDPGIILLVEGLGAKPRRSPSYDSMSRSGRYAYSSGDDVAVEMDDPAVRRFDPAEFS